MERERKSRWKSRKQHLQGHLSVPASIPPVLARPSMPHPAHRAPQGIRPCCQTAASSAIPSDSKGVASTLARREPAPLRWRHSESHAAVAVHLLRCQAGRPGRTSNIGRNNRPGPPARVSDRLGSWDLRCCTGGRPLVGARHRPTHPLRGSAPRSAAHATRDARDADLTISPCARICAAW